MKKSTIICLATLTLSTIANIIYLFKSFSNYILVFGFAVAAIAFIYETCLRQSGYSKKEKNLKAIIYILGIVWAVTYFLTIKYK